MLNYSADELKTMMFKALEGLSLLIDDPSKAAIIHRQDRNISTTRSCLLQCFPSSKPIINASPCRGQGSDQEGFRNFHISWSSSQIYCTFLGTVIIRKAHRTNEKNPKEYKKKRFKDALIQDIITLLPASWLSAKGVIVILERMIQEYRKPSMTLSLEAVRIISRGSMIYQACERGDFRTVRQLFENGHASPHDRTESGRNLLFAAGESVQGNIENLKKNAGTMDEAIFHSKQTEELVYYLISHGVESKELDVSGSS